MKPQWLRPLILSKLTKNIGDFKIFLNYEVLEGLKLKNKESSTWILRCIPRRRVWQWRSWPHLDFPCHKLQSDWLLFVCREGSWFRLDPSGRFLLDPPRDAANRSIRRPRSVADEEMAPGQEKDKPEGETALPAVVLEEEEESPSFNHLLISDAQHSEKCSLFQWPVHLPVLYWPQSSLVLLTAVWTHERWALAYGHLIMGCCAQGLLCCRSNVTLSGFI